MFCAGVWENYEYACPGAKSALNIWFMLNGHALMHVLCFVCLWCQSKASFFCHQRLLKKWSYITALCLFYSHAHLFWIRPWGIKKSSEVKRTLSWTIVTVTDSIWFTVRGCQDVLVFPMKNVCLLHHVASQIRCQEFLHADWIRSFCHFLGQTADTAVRLSLTLVDGGCVTQSVGGF